MDLEPIEHHHAQRSPAPPVGAVRGAGFPLPPTHGAPHYDIVLSTATPSQVSRLLAVLGPPIDNPFKRRRR